MNMNLMTKGVFPRWVTFVLHTELKSNKVGDTKRRETLQRRTPISPRGRSGTVSFQTDHQSDTARCTDSLQCTARNHMKRYRYPKNRFLSFR